jgi:chromosomal replication initiator protein
VPNKFYLDWVKEHYLPLIEKSIEEITGQRVKIIFTIQSAKDHPAAIRAALPAAKEPLRTRSVPEKATPAAASLNPKYTFDNFVVGSTNKFCHAASVAVAQSPGKTYNPLFIYGGVGLGKTHLMQAIGHFINQKNRKLHVNYVSSEKFTNQLIESIQNRTTVKFRNAYRNVDVLLIDDIHFLEGKEQTQEEFFHTFNTLYDNHKQIVISSDRPPKEIPRLEERLVSRFEWGLIADLQPPDLETRIAIVRKKAEISNLPLPDEIATFLANRIKSNIRKLEGALIRVVSYASLTGSKLTIEIAEEVLHDILISEAAQMISVDDIQKSVAELYDVRVADMKSQKRPKAIAYPRQVAMYLTRSLTQLSLPEIGDAFGGRDHSTVLHAVRLVEAKLKDDYSLRKNINAVTQKLKKY